MAHPEFDGWIAGEPTPDEWEAAYGPDDDPGQFPPDAPTDAEWAADVARDGVLIPGVRIAARRLAETLGVPFPY